MSVLDVEVSYFTRHYRPKEPKTVNLLTYLHSGEHREAVERIRQTADPETRKKLKDDLPGITPSGTFTYRDENHLLKHSGLIAGDIDFKDNPYTPESLKSQIRKIQEVAYCGLSASGRGLWFLVPVAYPDRHKEHFAALVADFARFGIRLDNAPANVASFRYCSFDVDAYFNPNAATYKRLKYDRPDTFTPTPRRRIEGGNAAKVEAILQQIEASRTDITNSYENWFAVGCALAKEFGQSGREYFHRASQFYPNYRNAETDRQFSNCLRMKSNRYTLGTFLEIVRRCGIEYKNNLLQPEN